MMPPMMDFPMVPGHVPVDKFENGSSDLFYNYAMGFDEESAINMSAYYNMSLEDLVNVYDNGTILTLVVLILGLGANLALLWSLVTASDRKSRLRPFLINLAIADLMVCCFTIAMELGWRLTGEKSIFSMLIDFVYLQ
jgi:hypothetical protein